MSEQSITTQELDNSSIIVEPARPEDAEAVFNVSRLTWLDTYPNAEAGITEEDIRIGIEGKHGELVAPKIERWREFIETGGEEGTVFVAKDTNKVVGFVAPGIIDGKRRVGAIYVLPGMQDKGIGSKLLREAIK